MPDTPTATTERLDVMRTEFGGHVSWTCRVGDVALTSDTELSEAQWLELAEIVKVEPQPVASEPHGDSPIEAEFKRQRDAFKVAAIGFVHQARECSLEDVLAACAGVAPMINGAVLIQTYIAGAAQQGLIAEPTFEAFREFVAGLTIQQLMEM